MKNYFSRAHYLGLIGALGLSSVETSYADETSPSAGVESGLVSILVGDSRFETLVTALKQAELLPVFQKGDSYTVFAPTNAAFAKLPEGTVENLLEPENLKELQKILTYHVAAGKTEIAPLLQKGKVATVEGRELEVKFVEGRIRINDGSLVDADVKAEDGIVHVIDTILLPPQSKVKTILTTAEEAGGFSTLLAAIGAAELDGILSTEGPFTVFAPTDKAFAKIPKETIAELLKKENREELVSILTTHVVKGSVRAGDALNAGKADSLSGETLTFSILDGQLKVNASVISSVDLDGGNGVIHVIDTVLLPSPDSKKNIEKSEQKLSQGRSFREAAGEMIVVAIEKGVPLYNSGDAEGCAKMYENCILSIIDLSQIDDRARRMLTKVVEGGKSHHDADGRAWLYRRTLDGMMHYLERPID